MLWLGVSIKVEDGTFALIVKRVNAKHDLASDINLPRLVMRHQLTNKSITCVRIMERREMQMSPKNFVYNF